MDMVLSQPKSTFLIFPRSSASYYQMEKSVIVDNSGLSLENNKISITHIENLINSVNYTKLDHGLTRSDVNPKDRQNYHSCLKLISDDVFNLLNDDVDSNGTVVYLTLLQMIVNAYIDRSTAIAERKSIFKTRKTIIGIYLLIMNF